MNEENNNNQPINENSELQTIQSELEQTKSKLAELTSISQQALADLQNYKKRANEEKAQFIIFANSALITKILPVLDNFERSLAHQPENNEWAAGINAIFRQLENVLQENGLIKISAETNTAFNPQLHEAISTQPGPADQILQSLENGYQLGEKILRRAKVIVGNGNSIETKNS